MGFFLFFVFLRFILVSVLLACMTVHHMNSWYLRSEREVKSPGTGVTDVSGGCWGLNQHKSIRAPKH